MNATTDAAPARSRTAAPKVLDAAGFRTKVARLSKLSVDEGKHFDAYRDVDWDAPEMQVDPADPRWVALDADPLRHTSWYAELDPLARSRFNLYRLAACMKIGWHFENFLQRGLLVRAMRLSDGSAELRYVHHEIIEESQHTLMFQELVARSGFRVVGMPWWARAGAVAVVAGTSRWDAELFFVLVLGGEDPIDHVQRTALGAGYDHPLANRIMSIHVTEEARHISFARTYLRLNVPKLGPFRRRGLAVAVPIVLGFMSRLMLVPPTDLRKECDLPNAVVREAFASPAGRQLIADSMRKVRLLCEELGLVTRVSRRVWAVMGLSDRRMDTEPKRPAASGAAPA